MTTDVQLTAVDLSPRRQARATVAWCEYRLAKLRGETGDLEWQRFDAVRNQVDAEQLAEGGLAPTTVEGALAVLDVAAEIIEVIGTMDKGWQRRFEEAACAA